MKQVIKYNVKQSRENLLFDLRHSELLPMGTFYHKWTYTQLRFWQHSAISGHLFCSLGSWEHIGHRDSRWCCCRQGRI